MKRLLIVLLIILLIAGAVFLIIWPFGTASGEKNENQRGTSETNVEVYIARPVSQSRQVSFTGRILPYNQIDIYAERSGVLDYLLYKEGKEVKKGDLIFSLVNNDLKARVENFDIQIDVTSKKIERKEKLFEREGISKEELEVEKANLSSLEAQKAQIQEELRKTRGIAPFDGIIGLRQKSNGAYVSPGDLITSLTASNKLIIEFDIPSKYAQIIKEGDSIYCAIEGIGVISSTIYSLSPSIDPETQTLEARALYSNSNGVI